MALNHGPRLKGATEREIAIRKRTFKVARALRVARTFSRSKRHAFGWLLEQAKKEHGIAGKPFSQMPERKALRLLDRQLLPRRGTLLKAGALLALRRLGKEPVSVKKEALVKKLFLSGNLGMFMIKPEMVSRAKNIRAFLKENGFRVVFNKFFVFAKEDIARLYPHALQNKEKYGKFAAQIFSLLSSPSLVVVFSHQPQEKYASFAKRHSIEFSGLRNATPQDAFAAAYKDFLRKKFTQAEFRGTDFTKGVLGANAKIIDALGFFEKSARTGTNPLVILNGIHVPLSAEIARDCRTLLTLTELEQLKKSFGGGK